MPTLDVNESSANIGSLPLQRARRRGSLRRWLSQWFGGLGTKELRRRLWHAAPGFLPLLLWPIPHADPLSTTLRWVIVAVVTVLAVRIFVQYRRIARKEDTHRLACVSGYAGCVIAPLLLFPSALEISFAVLAILAFGDGSATWGGKMIGGPALPWNPKKTWSGFVSFIAVGLPMSALIYWRETHNLEAIGPGVSFATAAIVCGIGVFTAAIAESLPSRINDNLRVGLAAIGSVALAHGYIVGW